MLRESHMDSVLWYSGLAVNSVTKYVMKMYSSVTD